MNVLVDTGLGRLAEVVGAPAGHLLTSLARVGLTPGDIDVVVLTHAHPDHIGGLVRDGHLTFARARHVISAREWNFWTSEAELARLPEMLAAPARALLPPLSEANAIHLTNDRDTEIVHGIHLLAAPGHTPGHCVVAVDSGASRAMFLADAIIDELQLTNLEWERGRPITGRDRPITPTPARPSRPGPQPCARRAY